MKAELFKTFVDEYPVSKTLRFSLIPVGRTLENIEKDGILDCDEKRSEEYKRVKKLLDEYYKTFIEHALTNVELDINSLEEYERLYNIKNKSDKEKADFDSVQKNLRKQIVKALKEDEKYKFLFKKEIIEKELVDFLNGRDSDVELVKSFKGYATMFQGFWDARKNIFSDEEKSTAIAYRIINENLPKFISNKNIYFTKIQPEMDAELDQLTLSNNSNEIRDIFKLEYLVNANIKLKKREKSS